MEGTKAFPKKPIIIYFLTAGKCLTVSSERIPSTGPENKFLKHITF